VTTVLLVQLGRVGMGAMVVVRSIAEVVGFVKGVEGVVGFLLGQVVVVGAKTYENNAN
jgi:hypothetical protein